MTLFDERERAFENLFAHEEGLRFRALARRNHLFARWAAEQIGLCSSECKPMSVPLSMARFEPSQRRP
jgi:hypothetical protein